MSPWPQLQSGQHEPPGLAGPDRPRPAGGYRSRLPGADRHPGLQRCRQVPPAPTRWMQPASGSGTARPGVGTPHRPAARPESRAGGAVPAHGPGGSGAEAYRPGDALLSGYGQECAGRGVKHALFDVSTGWRLNVRFFAPWGCHARRCQNHQDGAPRSRRRGESSHASDVLRIAFVRDTRELQAGRDGGAKSGPEVPAWIVIRTATSSNGALRRVFEQPTSPQVPRGFSSVGQFPEMLVVGRPHHLAEAAFLDEAEDLSQFDLVQELR